MYDTKKKKDELEKKDKVSSMITKDSVKKEDEKEEEKPDMRSKYAMINLIKNKLRAAGQRDPMVMAVDACEERTPAKDDPSFSQEYKDNAKKGIEASKNKNKNKKEVKPYNPYGENATANPTNMSGSSGP
jgi:aromatic ring hydroxylase